VPNSPRISTGASGLGSKVSMWLGPPCIHMRMQLTLRRCAGAVSEACRRRYWDSDRPSADRPPTRRNSRRVWPVQSADFLPVESWNMLVGPPSRQGEKQTGGKERADAATLLPLG